MRVYLESVAAYVAAGWPCIIPVPVATKDPPPGGFTGADGRDTDITQIVAWAGTHADWSIALRMPEGVIGIDVDHYDKRKANGTVVEKRGGTTLQQLEAKLGPLPATWISSARSLPSGIRFFRVPPRRYATDLGNGIEIIQKHHRYAVVSPSVNPDAGNQRYRWIDPDGHDTIPGPGQLPGLPTPWIEHLAQGATEPGPSAADITSGQHLIAALLADARQMCAEMFNATAHADRVMGQAETGSRHDIATARTYHIVQLGASGHPGAGLALAALGARWAEVTEGEARTDEWDRLLLSSARKAVTVVGTTPVARDPCLFAGNGIVSAAEQPPGWSVRNLLGAHPWNPLGELDQTLANAVLDRTWPVLRYAYDAKTWILRGHTRWAVRDDLAGWAVAELADLMPYGDAHAEKGSELQRQAARRNRLQTNGGRTAVAATMRALVAAGTHPSTVELAQLDAEPWLIWAGGSPWDLSKGQERPTLADLDPGTPHLHTATCAPETGIQTPLWDRWLATVWPDPAIRSWAVRVLSIALTGYSDAALPILLGPTRSGKSYTVELLLSVLGTYGAPASPQLFNAQRNTATDAIVAELKGLRLAFVDEYHLSVGPRQQELVKRLTGGARLTADAKGQKPITFKPTHTFIITSNPAPEIADPAIRARVRLIPCNATEDETYAAWQAITANPQQWQAEQPGVLARMMVEAARYLADPQSASVNASPATIQAFTGELASTQDVISIWLAEQTEPHPEGTQASILYQAHADWARRMNLPAAAIATMTAFGSALTLAGYPPQKRRDAFYRPLRVRLPSALGSWSVGGGSAGQPTTLEKPTSTAVSSSSVVGVVGIDTRSTTDTKKPLVPTTHEKSGTLQRPTTPTAPTTAASKPKGTRGRAVAERRAARLAAAAGPAVPLPVAVDRTGSITHIDVSQVDALLGTVVERGPLTVDVETTGYPVGHRLYGLRTVQLGDAAVAVVLDATQPDQMDRVRYWLDNVKILHAHSAVADLVPLAHAGVIDAERGWQRMYDTVIPAKLRDPSSTGSDPALKRLASAVLGDVAVAPGAETARAALWKAGGWLKDTKVDTPIERSGWAQVDSTCTTMIRYAAADVLDTALLAARLTWPDNGLLTRERATERIVSRVAHIGLRIDGQAVRALLDRETAAMEEARQTVCQAGIENPGSDSQVGARLIALGAELPSTPTGKPSVAKGALEALVMRADQPPEVRDLVRFVLDYRTHETAVTTFLRPWLTLVETGDGRARPTVYTLGAGTGRMSCVRPNLQQVPREGGFRPCIVADPGAVIISADFAGVELRVMAALSQDPHMIQMLCDGVDIHALIAAQVFGSTWTKADRYMVKRGVFGWAYGGKVETLAAQVGCDIATMAAVVDVLAEIAPVYVKWANSVKAAIRAGSSEFTAYSGRVIHLDKRQPHKGPNYLVQGSARELLVDALLKWDDSPYGRGVVLPVHDEVLAIVRAEDAEAATAMLVECMTTTLYGVPIVAEATAPAMAWRDAA